MNERQLITIVAATLVDRTDEEWSFAIDNAESLIRAVRDRHPDPPNRCESTCTKCGAEIE